MTSDLFRRIPGFDKNYVAGGEGRAKEYGVNSGNMSAALRGKTWAHVGEADAP